MLKFSTVYVNPLKYEQFEKNFQVIFYLLNEIGCREFTNRIGDLQSPARLQAMKIRETFFSKRERFLSLLYQI